MQTTTLKPTSHWTVTPLTGTIGAALSGGDLADPELDAAWLRSMLDEHLVLVLRNQFLRPADQVALARALGEPTLAHPVIPGHPDHPEILVVDGAKGGKNARWHTDVTFVPTSPAASILAADVVPESGGDTCWSNQRAAYDRLAAPLRAAIDELDAVHRISPLAYWGEPFDGALTRDDAAQLLDDSTKVQPVLHPMVRVHSRTGRRALYVNPGFTTHVAGLSRIESDGLLAMLYQHATQPELVMRHRWQPGDVVMWDNQATMHYATDDYGDTQRQLRRVTLRGTPAVGPTGSTSRLTDDPRITIR